MQIWLIVFGLPLVIYFWMALVPPGRIGKRAFILLAACIVLGWGAFFLDIGGFGGRDGPQGAYTILALTGVSTAFLLGATLRVLRVRLPQNWPGWVWPLCVVITLLAISWPLVRTMNG